MHFFSPSDIFLDSLTYSQPGLADISSDSPQTYFQLLRYIFSLSDMAEAELAEADQGAIQSGDEEGREGTPQHYLLPEVC